jgi:hypothetical protein
LVVAWIMNGFGVIDQWITVPISPDWQIRAAPDLNGNGVSSVLWSNIITGQQVIWGSTGAAFYNSAPFGVADPTWVVQP